MSKLTHSTDAGMLAVEIAQQHAQGGSRLVTSFVFPPIPMRKFDWCAHYDDPEGLCGWGETEQEAIADLIEQEVGAA